MDLSLWMWCFPSPKWFALVSKYSTYNFRQKESLISLSIRCHSVLSFTHPVFSAVLSILYLKGAKKLMQRPDFFAFKSRARVFGPCFEITYDEVLLGNEAALPVMVEGCLVIGPPVVQADKGQLSKNSHI